MGYAVRLAMAATALALGMPALCNPAHATVLREGGAGPNSLRLSVSTDTLPGTSATRYGVPANAPVVVRYTLVNSSEAAILNLHIADPDIPSSAISCVGGTARLPALASRQCTATVPAADGRRVRSVQASGTLYYFGTQVSATAETGYVGYNAGLSVHELVSGTDSDPGKPSSLKVGAPVEFDYQITNTGDVPLSGLSFHSTLNGTNCPAISGTQPLRPGAQVVCAYAPSAQGGLHLDTVVANATPQLSVLSGNGGVGAAAGVSASDQGAYLGVTPPPNPQNGTTSTGTSTSGGGNTATGGGAGSGHGAGAADGGQAGDAASSGPGGSGGASGSGHGTGAAAGGRAGSPSGPNGSNGSGNAHGPNNHQVGTAPGGGAAPTSPNMRTTAGSLSPIQHVRRALPWLMLVFLAVLVPVVIRMANGNRSGGR